VHAHLNVVWPWILVHIQAVQRYDRSHVGTASHLSYLCVFRDRARVNFRRVWQQKRELEKALMQLRSTRNRAGGIVLANMNMLPLQTHCVQSDQSVVLNAAPRSWTDPSFESDDGDLHEDMPIVPEVPSSAVLQ